MDYHVGQAVRPAGGTAMKTHRVELTHSNQTLFREARRLLTEGTALPEDRIETWRGDVMSMAGPVWAAAKLTVDESAGSGTPRFAIWRPFPVRRFGR
jgi:hypothetical protein